MQTRTRATLLTATTVLALAVGVFTPAAAQRTAFPDPADMGGASLNDIRRVTVNHGSDRLLVTIGFVDLRHDSEEGPASLTMLLDTRPAQAGPEFRLTTGLYDGTDYQLRRVTDGRPGEPLTCAHHVRLDSAADTLRFRAARSCLDLPARVRIGVKMTDLYDGSHPVTDWLGQPRSFTRWVSGS
jgi:hypothetical protein